MYADYYKNVNLLTGDRSRNVQWVLSQGTAVVTFNAKKKYDLKVHTLQAAILLCFADAGDRALTLDDICEQLGVGEPDAGGAKAKEDKLRAMSPEEQAAAAQVAKELSKAEKKTMKMVRACWLASGFG